MQEPQNHCIMVSKQFLTLNPIFLSQGNKIKKQQEGGVVKLSYNKNTKNYHYLQKAYGIQAMPFKNANTKHTYRETMLKQNKGHMVYGLNFPKEHSVSVQKPVKAK